MSHLLALVLAGLVLVAACVVGWRWGVWRWLAVLAGVPGLVVVSQRPIGAGFAVVVFSAAVVVLCWRSRPGPARLLPALVLLVAGAVVAHRTDDAAASGPGVLGWSLLGVVLVLALAAGAGLGRSRMPALRLAVLVTAGLPLVALLAAGSSETIVAWWPVDGALALTALLRGARGRRAALPQVDEVDRVALEDFATRYGAPSMSPVAVVIAAYDEAAGLPAVVPSVPDSVLGLATDLVVVDDGSADGTADAAQQAGASYVVRCPTNRGQGAALRLGYRVARAHGASYVITTDADGQYDVADFPAVLSPVLEGRADFVTGSRRLGRQPVQDPLRRLGVHVFAWLVSAMVGQRLTDTSFGLRAMRVEVTEAVTLNQPQYQSSELLLGALSHGFRVCEVPGTMHVRSAGGSKKGRNLLYGRRYAGVVLGTWWREGCPTPLVGVPAAPGSRDRAQDKARTRSGAQSAS